MEKNNIEKKEGKSMGMISVIVWLLTGLAVAAAAILYFLAKSNGKKAGERISAPTSPSPGSKKIPSREDCWKKYNEAAYEKKFTQCCKNVFTETSILFYLEKLFTAAHYGLKDPGWEKEKEMISYYINDGLDGALRYRMKDEKGGYSGPSRQSFKPDVDEETYYYQRGMDCENQTKENSENIRAEYQRLEEEIKHHLKEKNTIFYRTLWSKFQPDLKGLLEFGKKMTYNTDDDRKLKQEFEQLMQKTRGNIKKLGIEFIYDDEADKHQLKEYFQTGIKEEKEMAVVRASDHYIYYLGKTDIQMGEGIDEN